MILKESLSADPGLQRNLFYHLEGGVSLNKNKLEYSWLLLVILKALLPNAMGTQKSSKWGPLGDPVLSDPMGTMAGINGQWAPKTRVL